MANKPSALNDFRHGLPVGGFYFLEDENPDVYDALLAALMIDHKPESATEKILVGKMTRAQSSNANLSRR